jgi:hypothetical protein
MVEWETGEVATEPPMIISADDPVICAIYALENNLLDLPGWRQFERMREENALHSPSSQASVIPHCS